MGAGTSIVTVTGTTDYEKQVYPIAEVIFIHPLSNKLGTPTDDDALVTVRLLEDYVKGFTDYNFQPVLMQEQVQ